MNISSTSADAANRQLGEVLARLNSRLENRQFLVGDSFSRADLAAASLLAPFTRPEQYGISWPRPYPEDLETIISLHGDKLTWVNNFYHTYR